MGQVHAVGVPVDTLSQQGRVKITMSYAVLRPYPLVWVNMVGEAGQKGKDTGGRSQDRGKKETSISVTP